MELHVEKTHHFEASPPIVVQKVKLNEKNIFVVRDDLLKGGTKQRGLVDLLKQYSQMGYRRFAYASPFCGYAQVALSYLCQQMGFECILFCERDKLSSQLEAHSYTTKAKNYGSEVHLYDSLDEAQAELSARCREDRSLLQIPLGFDCPEFVGFYVDALKKQWELFCQQLGSEPKVLWLPVGSGTLTKSFLKVLEHSETVIHAADVHVLKQDDYRIKYLSENLKVKMFSAPMDFHVPEKNLPPFPSNEFYDAKLGPFIKQYGNDGDVWWNVAN